jgi:hypothetical protein
MIPMPGIILQRLWGKLRLGRRFPPAAQGGTEIPRTLTLTPQKG